MSDREVVLLVDAGTIFSRNSHETGRKVFEAWTWPNGELRVIAFDRYIEAEEWLLRYAKQKQRKTGLKLVEAHPENPALEVLTFTS